MTADITLAKGALSESVFTVDGTEGGDNKLTVLPRPTTKDNQAGGTKDTKVVDLLRITETFHIEAYITNMDGKTAKQVKENLKTMFKGANINGGPITLTYDGETYEVFCQKWNINKLRTPTSISDTVKDVAYYHVTLDLVIGAI